MSWEKDILIKILKVLELIGLIILFLINIIKKVLQKAFIPVVIGILILGVLYFGVNLIPLPF